MARVGLLGGPANRRCPAKLSAVYRDPAQPAVATPAELPDGLIAATLETVDKLRFDEALASRFLGCWLTEPSNLSVFDAPEDMDVDLEEDWPASGSLLLDRRSRMLYRGKQLFINGETAMVPTDAALRKLADTRRLDCADPLCTRLSDEARSCLADWLDSGWIRRSGLVFAGPDPAARWDPDTCAYPSRTERNEVCARGHIRKDITPRGKVCCLWDATALI